MAAATDNVYITGLPEGMSDEWCRQIFGAYGQVTSVKVLPPKTPGSGTCAGMVRFGTVAEAMWIVENLNGNIAQGLERPIMVKFASPSGGKGKDELSDSGKGLWGKAAGKGNDRAAPYGDGGGGGGGGGGPGTKTRLCTYFLQRGFCQSGASCTFAHGEHEIGMPRGAGPSPKSGGGMGGDSGASAGGSFAAGGGGKGADMQKMMAEMMKMMAAQGMPGMEGMAQTLGDVAAKTAADQSPGPAAAGSAEGTKSRLCSFFVASGSCPRANACTFAHGEHEIGMPRGDGGISMLMGGAKGSTSNIKTQMCRFFEQSGTCSRGAQCTFAHGVHEIGMPRGEGVPGAGNTVKMDMCKFFESNGICARGANCNYAHGADEIGTPTAAGASSGWHERWFRQSTLVVCCGA
eukprot:gnl/TRDRNA2_/TRDRNA2_151887_c0_seq3.p1 gnl/TRDRNA2_/TRDRNA2_151887_c0~~gnl/TRDRNA2_/TRDRNA2_151887_c0_seq3.p1  ORF type:complete len:404 (+),score=46.01 gnl/TRDRNA2_/TRDRNA2_151887_c0_seq3:60-1271(+)